MVQIVGEMLYLFLSKTFNLIGFYIGVVIVNCNKYCVSNVFGLFVIVQMDNKETGSEQVKSSYHKQRFIQIPMNHK